MGFLHIQNTILMLRKIYSYMDKICWSDRKTDKVQANIDI